MKKIPFKAEKRKFAEVIPARRSVVPPLPWLEDREPAAHAFCSKLQARCEVFFSYRDDRRRDGWLYAGRARTRDKARGLLHSRAPRSARAAAIGRTVGGMAARLDLRNLRVVDYGRSDGVSVDMLARDTGLSHGVVKGALADLRSCGHMGGHQVRERNAAGFFPRAQRWFTPRFFRALGLWRDLCSVRRLLGLAPPKEAKVIGPVQAFVAKVAAKVAPYWPIWPARE